MSFFANWGSLAAPAHLFLPQCLPSSYSSLFVRRPTDHLGQEQLLGKIQVTQDGTSSCLVLEFVPYRVYCIHKRTLSLSLVLLLAGDIHTMATMVSSQTALPPAPSQSYVEITNVNLLTLDSLTLEDFLRDPQESTAQENFLSNPLYHDATVAPPPIVVEDSGDENKSGVPIPRGYSFCTRYTRRHSAASTLSTTRSSKRKGKKVCTISHLSRLLHVVLSLTLKQKNGASTLSRAQMTPHARNSKPEFARKAAARTAAQAAAASVAVAILSSTVLLTPW